MENNLMRWDIINYLIKKYNLKSYLEIGVQNKICFNKIECSKKISVDPDKSAQATFIETSNDFFSHNKFKFGIIFIDGLHEFKQCSADITNSLLSLSEGGFIVIHDCNPITELMQKVPREVKEWTGDVWKSIVYMRHEKIVKTYVVDCDYGCAVICWGENPSLRTGTDVSYKDLESNRKELLNLISPEEFYKLF